MADPRPTDDLYQVTVDGVGTLTCRRRTIMDEMRVAQLYSEYLGGAAFPTDWLNETARHISLLRVVVVTWPAGVALDDLDPLDRETWETIAQIAGAVRVREEEFRAERKQARPG